MSNSSLFDNLIGSSRSFGVLLEIYVDDWQGARRGNGWRCGGWASFGRMKLCRRDFNVIFGD